MKKRILFFIHTCARFGHFGVFVVALYAAFLLRFDFAIPPAEKEHVLLGVLLAALAKSIVFGVARVHRVVWRFTGITEMVSLLKVNVIASILFTLACAFFIGRNFPRSIYVLDLILCTAGTASILFMGRLYSEGALKRRRKASRRRIVIYGAGQAGMTLAREIVANPGLRYELIGFLDDSNMKRSARIHGIPVLGSGRKAAQIVSLLGRRGKKIDEIVIAMPSASAREMQEALANCRMAGVACKTVPGLGEMLSGKVLSAQIRDVSVTDLLGRPPVHIEEVRVRESLRGRAVLVTGAAGSIGSEICRQVAGSEPAVLVAFDQAESELFRIDAELRHHFPSVRIEAFLGDIRDESRVREVVQRFSIEMIFHAAAYKHVPMVEAHPLEAIRNNILGTWNLVRIARSCGVSSFLMISSDKAVNPSSVMGATKRVDELILSAMPTGSCRFVSVRFGNVLGSNGSVIPTFQEQIKAGGPVTVTHPDMRRYFMTIREAVQLVLVASTMGKGSEVFVLDMGEPVRIVDLARQMIRLAGKIPDEEIEIRFTGLRPGEKLYEEINSNSEELLPTTHRKIQILQTSPVDEDEVEGWMSEFEEHLANRDGRAVVALLRAIIPEFQCDAHWLPEQAAAAAASSGASGSQTSSDFAEPLQV